MTPSQVRTILKIQKWWKRKAPTLRRKQGPALYIRSISQNDTELYSLDPITAIPSVFFFSYADSRKLVWSFDIRSLLQHFSQSGQHLNPYTRDEVPEKTIQRYRSRIDWLRARKYVLIYGMEEELTPEQEWNQKVLDVFMKIESLGYLASTKWFHDLNIKKQQRLYRELYFLWLGLSPEDKEDVCPGHSIHETRLFSQTPDDSERIHPVNETNSFRWWGKHTLQVIHCLTNRGSSKAVRSLGALYTIMSLVKVSISAEEAYPWLA